MEGAVPGDEGGFARQCGELLSGLRFQVGPPPSRRQSLNAEADLSAGDRAGNNLIGGWYR